MLFRSILHRFISKKIEVFKPSYSPIRKDVSFEVTILEVREPIINYLKNVLGEKETITELREIFEKVNNLTLEEYLDEKTKYLLNLDLEKYSQLLNDETNKRRAEKAAKLEDNSSKLNFEKFIDEAKQIKFLRKALR